MMKKIKNFILKAKDNFIFFIKKELLFLKKIAVLLIAIFILLPVIKVPIQKLSRIQEEVLLEKTKNMVLEKQIKGYQKKVKRYEKIIEDGDIATEIAKKDNWVVVNRTTIRSEGQIVELSEELESITCEDGITQEPKNGTKIIFERPTGDKKNDGKPIFNGFLVYHYIFL